MIHPAPPAPPPYEHAKPAEEQSQIVDEREKFAKKRPPTGEESERARAFIAGKIDMVRNDPTMSEADKTAAIADLERKRRE